MTDLRKLMVLIVEDSEDDALLIVRELKRGGYEPVFERVETEKDMRAALEGQEWDIIISDYKMPHFNGLAALEIYKETGPDIPFIIVSGSIGEEIAAETMVSGAHDYVMKNNLARLLPAVQRELREAQLRKARRRSAKELILTELRLKALLQLYQMADAPLDEIIDFVVEECQKISESKFSFIGFINEDETVMHTHLWPRKAMEQCTVDGKPVGFPLKRAGLWCEAIRQRKVVIVNNYADPNPYKKGSPEGHFPLTRFVGVPLIDKNRVVLVAGLANKKEPYIESDMTHVSLLLEGMWNYIQKRNAETELRKSLEFQQQLIDALPLPVFYKDLEGRYLGCNEAFEKFFGMKREEIAGRSVYEISQKNNADIYHEKDLALIEDPGGTQVYESLVRDTGGDVHNMIFHKAVFRSSDGPVGGLIGVIFDITPLKKAQKEIDDTLGKLRKSEETLLAAINATHESLVMIDRQGTVLLSNIIAAERLGKSVPELLGTCIYGHFSEDVAGTRKEWFDKVFDTGKTVHFEDMRAGRHFELYVYPVFDGNNEISRVAIFAREITDRKQAEDALRKSEEKYRSIFENVIEGIFQTVPEGRFISVNPAMAHIHGFASPEEMVAGITDIGKQLYQDPGIRKKYVRILEEKGKIENFEAQVHRRDGSIIWTSVNARTVRDAAGNILRFEGTSEEITERKKAEEELKTSTLKLRKSLIGTIQVISMMLETRDPYTGGHQNRVSNLARAIAQEMALSKEMIDSIRMAGSIHDIGKMSVPAEILSKPTRLSDIEMSILKVHPQTGYDILRVVELPPPIAEIVLQHHERLDGSGYPQGLKDGEILLEAQIMSVADVVEAMAAHRPYRPAIGIDAALEEIEKNKGILYNREVAEACVRLFREKGFKFE